MSVLRLTTLFLVSALVVLPLSSVNAEVDYSIEIVDNIRITKRTTKRVQLKWKRIEGVEFYQIKTLREKSNGKFRFIKRNRTKRNSKKFLVKKLRSGLAYYFKIRACTSKMNCGPWSDTYRAVTKAPDPVIKNLLVDFEDWDQDTGRAGAFDFNASYSEDKVFLEFGAEVEDAQGGAKLLPTFEYRVSPEANVYSPINGYIVSRKYQDSTADYEIGIGTVKNYPSITVGIDHIKDLTVKKGDYVKAGDILGAPGTWSSTHGRVELDIYGSKGHYCPFTFFGKKLRSEYEQKIEQHMQDWEAFKLDTSIYDEEGMTYAAGCSYKTLTEDEL